MALANADICAVTEFAWQTMTGDPLTSVEGAPHDFASGRSVTACIQITGAWVGAVVLTVSEELSKQITATLFDIEHSEVGHDDLMDAMGEMVNVVSGNLKALLPAPSALSLPTVTNGGDYMLHVPGSTVVNRVDFASPGSEPVSVTVMSKEE